MVVVLTSRRGIPTHRGWVKKIRFAPGKGNQKLLVMYTDGVEVWDTKEVSDHTWGTTRWVGGGLRHQEMRGWTGGGFDH